MFLIFYSIVLIIYGSVNYYIYSRGMQALPAGTQIRAVFPWIFWILVSTYVIGRVLESYYISTFSDVLVWTGSFWLGAMFYLLLIVFLLDLLRWINLIIPFYPSFITVNYEKAKLITFSASAVLVIVLMIAGHINMHHPVVKNLELKVNKPANGITQLHAVLVSDIHLGTLMGKNRFEKVIDMINAQNPDIVLLAGDVLDEDLKPVIRQNSGEKLKRLNAQLGVYAVMGNHEYIGGAEPAYNYLKDHGLIMLRDTVVKIKDAFYLVGREDRDKPRFSGKDRMPLPDLVNGDDMQELPIILMDHQPYYLEEAAELGVDIQVSGHTHHGQMWPLNFITRAVYTLSFGYAKIGNMHAYVSNGIGTWGPPVRIGNRPEIVNLMISFSPSELSDLEK